MVASGMAGSRCSKQDFLLQLLPLLATVMVSFSSRPFYAVAKMDPNSHCSIYHWLWNSEKRMSVSYLFQQKSQG